MGRPKRARKESLKKREMNETTKCLMKSVINKPPTKALIRSAKALLESKREQGKGRMQTQEEARMIKTASQDAVELSEMMTPSAESARVNIKSVVETKREKVRERKAREAKDDDVMMMDPVKILKNPKEHLSMTYNVGLPLEGFEKKICRDPKCNYPIRRYILGYAKEKDMPKDADGNVIPDEPGFVSLITTEMCCSPAACVIPTELKVSKVPQNLYRKRLSICDESLLLTDEEMKLIAARKEDPSIDTNPIPNQDIVMSLVKRYVDAGKPKFQMKKFGPFTSEKHLVDLMDKYEAEQTKKDLGLGDTQDDDDSDSD